MAERRLAEETSVRKDLEYQHEQRLNDMKRQIEVKQRDLESLQAKMALPVDTDILRMKLAKDMEGRHRLEVETKQQECDRLADQFYE